MQYIDNFQGQFMKWTFLLFFNGWDQMKSHYMASLLKHLIIISISILQADIIEFKFVIEAYFRYFNAFQSALHVFVSFFSYFTQFVFLDLSFYRKSF